MFLFLDLGVFCVLGCRLLFVFLVWWCFVFFVGVVGVFWCFGLALFVGLLAVVRMVVLASVVVGCLWVLVLLSVVGGLFLCYLGLRVLGFCFVLLLGFGVGLWWFVGLVLFCGGSVVGWLVLVVRLGLLMFGGGLVCFLVWFLYL